MKTLPKIVAITGGSGCGKSWLAGRLLEHFGVRAARVSLDDFYRDRSHLAPARRLRVNYDHPNAIDWELFQTWLRNCRRGICGPAPRYDFKTHTRQRGARSVECGIQPALVVIEGLWLLRKPAVRSLIDLSIFIECPEGVRLERRHARDVAERGRSPAEIRRQLRDFVFPMHDRYVAPQGRWADIVVKHPVTARDVLQLTTRIESLLLSNQSKTAIPCRSWSAPVERRACAL